MILKLRGGSPVHNWSN